MSGSGILFADRIVTGDQDLPDSWIEIESGHIVHLGSGAPPAGATRVDGTIIPGFVDIHAHGAVGVDFGRADAGSVRAAAQHHASRGTTTMIASIASAPLDSTVAALDRLAPLVDDGTLGGIHLEGPYLSSERRGAHNPEFLRLPAVPEIRELLATGRGAIRCVTIAPELADAEAVIRVLADADVVVAMGHTDATAEIAHDAVSWGVTHATHLYNGMPEFRHRQPGPVGAALADERVTIELIVDGVHLAEDAVTVAFRAAPGRICLVSDASEATGQPDGEYEIAGSRILVTDGVAMLADRSSLAGSTRVLADCFRQLLALEGVSLLDAVRATSVTPARAMGLPATGLVPNAAADLLVLDPTSGKVVRVMRRGKWLE